MDNSFIDKLNALKRDFNSLTYDYGVVTKNSKVDFVFRYEGTDPIHCISVSCGCTDPMCIGNTITGKLAVGTPVEKNGLYTDGESFYVRHRVGEEWAYRDVLTGTDELSPERTFVPVKAGQKNQGVTVYFDPDEEFFTIDENLVRKRNPEKRAINLTIQGWVLLEEPKLDVEQQDTQVEFPAS